MPDPTDLELKVLAYLFSQKEPVKITEENFPEPELFQWTNYGMSNSEMYKILLTLKNSNYIDSKDDNTHWFIEPLGEKKIKPLLKAQEKAELKKTSESRKAELEIQQLQANIDLSKSIEETNASIQALNTKTKAFYDKQKDYNKIQKNLTYAIAGATIISALLGAMALYNSNTKTETPPQNSPILIRLILPKPDSIQKPQIKIDSSFQKIEGDSVEISQ